MTENKYSVPRTPVHITPKLAPMTHTRVDKKKKFKKKELIRGNTLPCCCFFLTPRFEFAKSFCYPLIQSFTEILLICYFFSICLWSFLWYNVTLFIYRFTKSKKNSEIESTIFPLRGMISVTSKKVNQIAKPALW